MHWIKAPGQPGNETERLANGFPRSARRPTCYGTASFAMTVVSSPLISLALTLGCMAVPWWARRVKTWQILTIFAIGLILWLAGGLLSLGWYPWTSIIDVVVAVGAGALLGRVVSAKFWPFFVFLLIVSALDTVQVLLAAHSVAPATATAHIPAGELYSNVIIKLPWGKYGIGPVDLLILVMIATYWCRKGGGFFTAFLGPALGVVVAYGVLLMRPGSTLALIPLLMLGWLLSVAITAPLLRARLRVRADDSDNNS